MGKRDNNSLHEGRYRQRILTAFIGLFFALLVARLFTLQAVRHDEYSRFAEDNHLQRERFIAPRGYILDREGRVLVDNVLQFQIIQPWHNESEIHETVGAFSEYFPLDSTRVASRLSVWKRRNGRAPFPIVPDADKQMISFVRENSDLFPQLRVVSRARRRYRRGDVGAHLLGYVGEVGSSELNSAADSSYYPGDMVGKTALELACEADLRGQDGQRVLEVNAAGTVLGEMEELSTMPVPGQDVTLTIDAELQEFLQSLLSDQGPSAAVVLDVNDGAIIAAASHPSYDPNVFTTGLTQEQADELFDENKKPLFNRVHQARYPPASTVKVISAYAILTNRLVDPNQVIAYCTGAHRFGNRVFRCWLETGHGPVNLMKGVVESCDVYFYKVAEIMDVDDLAVAARAFGMGEKTGVDLPGETRGLVPDREYYDRRMGKGKWTQGHMLNNIIGQGEYLANVLQVTRMCAAVANGGYLVQPHVVLSKSRESAEVYPKKRIPGLTGETLKFLQRAMINVVQKPTGTAFWTRLPGMKSGGKTGTAQNPHGDPHSWYTAYAPAVEPEIAITVIVENAGHGSEVAAPIAKRFMMRYFGLEPPPPQKAGDASRGEQTEGADAR